MCGLSLGTYVSNLMSVALTVLELLAFNTQKIGGYVTLSAGHALFQKIFKGSCRTIPGNMLVKFEVHSINHFKLVWLTGPLCTHTRTQTHIEQKQYLLRSFRSLGRNKYHCYIHTLDYFLHNSDQAYANSSVPKCLVSWCHCLFTMCSLISVFRIKCLVSFSAFLSFVF